MQTAALVRPPDQAGIPGVRRVDHFAFTVPDLPAAVTFFTEVLGGELCYVEGPVEDPEGDWMTRKLGVHPRASAKVALVRVGPSTNVELFEYTAPGRRTRPPGRNDTGWTLLSFRVDGIARAVDRLREHPGLTIESDVTTPTVRPGRSLRRVGFRTPWGQDLQLCGDFDPFAPADAGEPGPVVGEPGPVVVLGAERLALAVADLDAAVGFFISVIGATPLPPRRPLPPGAQPRVTLRLGPTDRIELRQAGPDGSTTPPRNSDAGGHHIAFHTDDVDAAARHLAAQPGVHVMGAPETIASGPIAGNRWVYFGTPVGVQMEVLCMPDGRLPYERETAARRAVSRDHSWH
ncbi:VOC family protein [Streptomyces sp. NBC_01310]|uniref:VOC family protein n=1 Tax=Streptomyces sp. NBC_01310 TaxID=2903820 RepID=UPI0035B5A428|nr:VOC family protein [Streptomyces sp. NBC_01310]